MSCWCCYGRHGDHAASQLCWISGRGLVAWPSDSLCTQFYTKMAQIEKEKEVNNSSPKRKKLPSLFQAVLASAVLFSLGGMMPLTGAIFARNHKIRLAVCSSCALGQRGLCWGKTQV